jgi:CheY-like chemotaxis protein
MSDEDKVNILVVDDVPDKLLTMEAILEELGQNVVCVGSGREALRRLLYEDFAVILLDVNMPDMDGFETAALIRQRKRSESTPIIFVTAFSDETHAFQGYSLGAVDYLHPDASRSYDPARQSQRFRRAVPENSAGPPAGRRACRTGHCPGGSGQRRRGRTPRRISRRGHCGIE